MATVRDDDLFIINRAGKDYQVPFSAFKTTEDLPVPTVKASVVDGVPNCNSGSTGGKVVIEVSHEWTSDPEGATFEVDKVEWLTPNGSWRNGTNDRYSDSRFYQDIKYLDPQNNGDYTHNPRIYVRVTYLILRNYIALDSGVVEYDFEAIPSYEDSGKPFESVSEIIKSGFFANSNCFRRMLISSNWVTMSKAGCLRPVTPMFRYWGGSALNSNSWSSWLSGTDVILAGKEFANSNVIIQAAMFVEYSYYGSHIICDSPIDDLYIEFEVYFNGDGCSSSTWDIEVNDGGSFVGDTRSPKFFTPKMPNDI